MARARISRSERLLKGRAMVEVHCIALGARANPTSRVLEDQGFLPLRALTPPYPLPPSLPPSRRERGGFKMKLFYCSPSSPGGWEGGWEKRAGVMRAGGAATVRS